MAKYEDYVKKYGDPLAEEIDEAQADHQERVENQPEHSGFDMPERFRDKPPEEIARSYVELEKKLSQQGQTIGEYRKLIDDFMKSQLTTVDSNQAHEAAESKPLDLDELYDNTDTAVRRVVKEEAGREIERLQQELETIRAQSRLQQMEARFPGWREEAQSSEFVEWVQESPFRVRLAVEADNRGDLDAAEELLGLYYETKQMRESAREASNPERERVLRDGSLETGAADVPVPEDKFSRAELMELRIRAKRGDPEAETFLAKNRAAIAAAYESGNITD